MSTFTTLPDVPVKHAEFIPYIASNAEKPLPELLEPFKQYDAKLREVFAQEPNHPALADKYLNIVPVFEGHEKDVTIRARNLEAETQEEKDRYIMPLDDEERRPNGSPAIVQDIKDFQQNFTLFCESSLVDLDWSNVVAAGSSVVTCLLPVPEKHKKSKKALRHYYHEKIAPASDVDLFIYGLSEEEAIKKIIDIEQRVKDSILTEITTIRTKNAITIASQYPTRHIQIVLRAYKSVAEILTGFDVDCSCAAYDGKQVYAAPRALTSYMTQTNTIDLTRRSPSYENRLSKYSRRGFEVYWPLLDRSRIDPTIFERNFGRTLGLARLLVLERLPTKSEREAYMDERRRERGRPVINRPYFGGRRGNIKDRFEDEVAEWVEQEDVSDYHTFTIPYGPKYHAKKIEKLLYTKDLLLNAEWNKQKDREVNLHRHPAFFGYAEDVIHDCCGSCPEPVTDEEHVVAEEEAKIYVSGEISFIKDNPGRQAIGSFHPLTDDDWTEMAYVGNTARLSQAIVDGDLEHVEDWLSQEGADPNCRDYTGRTPLHLAIISSTPEIVKSLIDHGARLVARLADGRTALHLAADRGNVEMVRLILNKSEENEEEEAKKEEARKQARTAEKQAKTQERGEVEMTQSPEDSDAEMIDAESESDEDMKSTTTGSYVKVNNEEKDQEKDIPEEDDDEPDVYDVNVLSWDTKCSPLHYAILGGHVDVVKELVQTYGADVLLPIKLLNSHTKTPIGAILTLILALKLPLEKAQEMTRTLLELGATCAQADMRQTTALHFAAVMKPENPDVLDIYFQHDEPAAKRILNHMAVFNSHYSPEAWSPLMSAIYFGNPLIGLKLLEAGAHPTIEFKDWIKSVEAQFSEVSAQDHERNHTNFLKYTQQPLVLAVQSELTDVALALLERGANPDALPFQTQHALKDEWQRRYQHMESVLDIVRSKIEKMKKYLEEAEQSAPKCRMEEGRDYLEGLDAGSYKHFVAQIQVDAGRKADKEAKEGQKKENQDSRERKGEEVKQKAVSEMLTKFIQLEEVLVAKGAKTFAELHPDITNNPEQNYNNYNYFTPKKDDSPFEVAFSFNVHDLTDETREAYLELFQAAWDGDLDKIKSLTLLPHGPDRAIPLKIAVKDKHDYSPFSIAVLRGHRDVAKAIVEIAFAQYQPDDKPKNTRYRMEEDDDSDESASMSDSDADTDMQVHATVVTDTFTIDNVGEVATQVKSNVQPLAVIGWQCRVFDYQKIFHPETKFTYGLDEREVEEGGRLMSLLEWSIISNDKDLFQFMADLDYDWTQRSFNAELPDCPQLPQLDDGAFERTIKYGRLDMLAEEIRRYGAGIDLESLVRKSGVKLVEKPKYYQGLSVHGRKREDWVNAARGHYRYNNITDQSPPLLQAAFDGRLATVEWFLSDTPARLYKEFGETNKENKFIKHLNTSAGGFDKVVSKWLGARREHALHCAVMAPPTHESLKLIEYLLQIMPDSVNTKSLAQGHTPLALAFSLGRLDAAKLLIAAGADQTIRDNTGANILHLLLVSPYIRASRTSKDLTAYLDLIDKRLIPSLLTQRCSISPGSLTPFALWLQTGTTFVDLKEPQAVLRTILDLAQPTNNEHLEHLDASGETPLHFAVKRQMQAALRVMLEYRPDLLYRENSVGATPAELARDRYLSERVQKAPCVGRDPYRNGAPGALEKPAMGYGIEAAEAEGKGEDKWINASVESICRLCEAFAAKRPGKRKLVSLQDANEVANRLAEGYGGRRTREWRDWRREEEDGGSEKAEEEEEKPKDEVAEWYGRAVVTWFDQGPRAWFG